MCVFTALLTILLTAALFIIFVMVIYAAIDIAKHVSKPRIVIGQQPHWLRNKHYDHATTEALKVAWIEDKLINDDFNLKLTQQYYNDKGTILIVYLYPYKHTNRSVKFKIENGFTLIKIGYSRS